MKRRSIRHGDSPASDSLTAANNGLAAVAALWKKTRRELVAQFDGISMRPAIEPQQALTIRCGEEAHPGDVVMFVRDGGPIVHRVIWESPGRDWFLTRGDNRHVPDAPVARDDVTGVVMGIAAHQPDRSQRALFLIVRAAAAFGRRFAHVTVRLLQLTSHVRHFRGGRMGRHVIHSER
jgi:hypothetical protein